VINIFDEIEVNSDVILTQKFIEDNENNPDFIGVLDDEFFILSISKPYNCIQIASHNDGVCREVKPSDVIPRSLFKEYIK